MKFANQSNRRVARGVSLAETMLALCITTVLLLAVGAAFDGSFKNYKQNQALADCLQDSRLLMNRLMTQARQSSYLSVNSGGLRVQVETPDDLTYQYIYVYVPASKQVQLSRMNLGTLVAEPLGSIDNVTSFTIPSEQWIDNPPRLTCSLTVTSGGNTATLSDSAVPRTTISF